MKKTFIVITELGRERGRVSAVILEVDKEGGINHVCDFNYSIGSNMGLHSEFTKKAVNCKALPKEALEDDGYTNYNYKKENYHTVFVEGKGLNYWSAS